jgi:tetratricopeptide (TPR) repeat protein
MRYRFPAAAMLGRIYRDEGKAVDAIDWFERAAAVTAPTPDEGWTLLYHLGTALDAIGERARALAVFLELQGTAGMYRDVEQRVARLTTILLGG